jgi:phosphatidylglycerol:prolipoprotein diacylglycerol transferase
MQPEIHLGGLTLQTFGICFAAGFLVAAAVLARYLREVGKPSDWAYEAMLAALIGGLVGSRLDFMAENWDVVKGDLFGNLFSGSGLVWYGGAIGGAIGVLAWAWWRGLFGVFACDMAAVPLAVGYAFGRIGCQLSGDGDYGKAWDGPWAMSYPNGTEPTTQNVHPTPIYETLAMGLIAYALWRVRHRFRPGILFALYLVLAGLERLLVEFIRRNDDVLLGLTQAQLISLGMMIAGGIWIAVIHRRYGTLERPDAAPSGAEPAPAG